MDASCQLGLDLLAIADAGNACAHVDDACGDATGREVCNAHSRRSNAAKNQQKPRKARCLALTEERENEADGHNADANSGNVHSLVECILCGLFACPSKRFVASRNSGGADDGTCGMHGCQDQADDTKYPRRVAFCFLFTHCSVFPFTFDFKSAGGPKVRPPGGSC